LEFCELQLELGVVGHSAKVISHLDNALHELGEQHSHVADVLFVLKQRSEKEDPSLTTFKTRIPSARPANAC
jgi:hypothetical protein